MREAKRIQALPPYLFAQIEAKIAKARQAGVDVINLGIGDPDLPTPSRIVEKLTTEAKNPPNYRYPTSAGLMDFRQAVATWYKQRFGVALDPASEVLSLIGSKEGIANISFCFLDQGDISLVPDPGYPVYASGALLAGATVYKLPLLAENGFLPDLDAIPEGVLQQSQLLWLNYPNNPTGAIADKSFFVKAVALAKQWDLLLCHDAAYTEIAYDGYQPISILSVDGAKDVCVEFHSLSKTYNMTGWRLGWVVGNKEAVGALHRLKTNIDSGVFQAVQYAGISALAEPIDPVVLNTYHQRRDLVISWLRHLQWQIAAPKATIYIWAPVPSGFTSVQFAEYVFEKTNVVITPGIGYGDYGDDYFRISICLEAERIEQAFKRWAEVGILFN